MFVRWSHLTAVNDDACHSKATREIDTPVGMFEGMQAVKRGTLLSAAHMTAYRTKHRKTQWLTLKKNKRYIRRQMLDIFNRRDSL